MWNAQHETHLVDNRNLKLKWNDAWEHLKANILMKNKKKNKNIEKFIFSPQHQSTVVEIIIFEKWVQLIIWWKKKKTEENNTEKFVKNEMNILIILQISSSLWHS